LNYYRKSLEQLTSPIQTSLQLNYVTSKTKGNYHHKDDFSPNGLLSNSSNTNTNPDSWAQQNATSHT